MSVDCGQSLTLLAGFDVQIDQSPNHDHDTRYDRHKLDCIANLQIAVFDTLPDQLADKGNENNEKVEGSMKKDSWENDSSQLG